MEISFDPAKNEKNIHERYLSLERAVEFDFQGAIFLVSSWVLKFIRSPRPTDTPLIKGGRGDGAQSVLLV